MRIEIKPEDSYHLINHSPCSLITTGDRDRQNVAPINWTMPLNNDPALMLTVVEEGITTDDLIKSSGEFVINVVGEPLAEKVLDCGKTHGSETNKFEKIGLTPVACRQVTPPRLAESLAHIECKVVDRHPHEGVTIYIGKVLHAEVEEECWNGKRIIPEKARTIHHLSGGEFVVAERVIRIDKKSH